MAQIIREITIDVARTNNLRAITAKQNDLNSRFLKINITDTGNPLKVDLSSQVIMNVKRTDNEAGMFYGSVNDDGSVTVPLTSWMLAIPGSINCDVSIISTDDSQKLTSMQFSIYVEEAVYPQEVLEENENYDVLVELLGAAEKAQECVEATEEAKEAATLAEAAASGVRIVEQNNGSPLKFWVGTQAEYEAIANKEFGCFYIISDDSDLEYILGLISGLDSKIDTKHTIYDISSAVTPGNSVDTYKLLKYGNILFLEYTVKATEDADSTIFESDKTICTIEGYTPLIGTHARLCPVNEAQVSNYPYLKIDTDVKNKNFAFIYSGGQFMVKWLKKGDPVFTLDIVLLCD